MKPPLEKSKPKKGVKFWLSENNDKKSYQFMLYHIISITHTYLCLDAGYSDFAEAFLCNENDLVSIDVHLPVPKHETP